MLWFKFSFLLILFAQHSNALMFTPQICLMSKYETEIKHEGKFFGLIKNDLSISKDECTIEVTYKNILDTRWRVDICREPVHLKVLSKGSLEVFKRHGDCSQVSDDFCRSWKELELVLQDHGLIFAEGERETLDTSHGKTYCSYLLLKKYLKEGVLFSKYKTPVDIFNEEARKKEVNIEVELEQDKEEAQTKDDEDSSEVRARF